MIKRRTRARAGRMTGRAEGIVTEYDHDKKKKVKRTVGEVIVDKPLGLRKGTADVEFSWGLTYSKPGTYSSVRADVSLRVACDPSTKSVSETREQCKTLAILTLSKTITELTILLENPEAPAQEEAQPALATDAAGDTGAATPELNPELTPNEGAGGDIYDTDND